MTENAAEGSGARPRTDSRDEDFADVVERLGVVERKTVPLLTAAIRRLLDVEIESPAELPDAAAAQHDRFQEYEARLTALERQLDRLGDLEREQTTKEQKMAAVLAYADNKRDTGQSTVAVTAAEIKGCVGVSRRYAYELVDAIATDVTGCGLREATTVETSTGTKQKPKAVLVDCEAVHGDGGRVNSFTTTTEAETNGKRGGEARERGP